MLRTDVEDRKSKPDFKKKVNWQIGHCPRRHEQSYLFESYELTKKRKGGKKKKRTLWLFALGKQQEFFSDPPHHSTGSVYVFGRRRKSEDMDGPFTNPL